jgi:hypothetical protein
MVIFLLFFCLDTFYSIPPFFSPGKERSKEKQAGIYSSAEIPVAIRCLRSSLFGCMALVVAATPLRSVATKAPSCFQLSYSAQLSY